MILIDDIFPIGRILKPHGVNGEMSFQTSVDLDDFDAIDCFIVEKQGIFVPFFVNELRPKTNITGLLIFDGITSDEQAREFSGATIYLQKKHIHQINDQDIELHYFVGFELIDEQYGFIGIVEEVDETTDNSLFVIIRNDNELLIPVCEEYIHEIDHDAKKIYLELPDGLLDL